MKKIIIIITLLIGFNIQAQILQPVKLSFSANKIGKNTYEVHLKAKIDNNWHIFSQYSEQDEGIGPLPTNIVFNKNSQVMWQGKPKEVGNLKEEYNDIFGVKLKYFYNEVEFVQTVKTTTDKPITLTGTITYMACKEEQCLTPQEVEFEVTLK